MFMGANYSTGAVFHATPAELIPLPEEANRSRPNKPSLCTRCAMLMCVCFWSETYVSLVDNLFTEFYKRTCMLLLNGLFANGAKLSCPDNVTNLLCVIVVSHACVWHCYAGKYYMLGGHGYLSMLC